LSSEESELPYEAYFDLYFYISQDGNNVTLFTIGDSPEDTVLYIEVLTDTSFRLREYGDEDWLTFSKI